MNQAVTLLLLVWLAAVQAQPLDWTTPMTLYGTPANEHSPGLTALPSGRILRAFCAVEDTALYSRISTDQGATWSAFSSRAITRDLLCLDAVSDRDYSYQASICAEDSALRVYRFAGNDYSWAAARVSPVYTAATGRALCALTLATNALLAPDSPALLVCWTEWDPATQLIEARCARSFDHGVTFVQPSLIYSAHAGTSPHVPIRLVSTGTATQQRWALAACLDRPGSVLEAIRVFVSDNYGGTWSSGVTLDSSAYAQTAVGLAAWGTTVFAAFTRRTGAASARELFFCYSPDGGSVFSPPELLALTAQDEFDPQICVSETGTDYLLSWQSTDALARRSTLWRRQGSVQRPWVLEEPIVISDSVCLQPYGGCAVVASEGFCAAWTSVFLRDSDIRFDASWRGQSADFRPSHIPADVRLEQNYPNPFNGTTLLPLNVHAAGPVSLVATDLLGRTVRMWQFGQLGPGHHSAILELSDLPSGTYFLSARGHARSPAIKMQLLR